MIILKRFFILLIDKLVRTYIDIVFNHLISIKSFFFLLSYQLSLYTIQLTINLILKFISLFSI
jgi:hypothetical protein